MATDRQALTTPPPLESLAPLNAALAGRYALMRELGHGGMATVYLARDLRHHRDVAVKVLQPDLAAYLGPERFRREIDVAASLSHPHILPLHDSGEADGFLFYVMPYVSGETLRSRMNREGQLPVGEAVDLITQVASALQYSHARGVVHRDIKPENLLIHEGMAVVADFGIALSGGPNSGERITGTGLALGTPEYMSPEQSLGERELDARSDVYSLACVLYEMLAGEPPFSGASTVALTAKRLTDQPPDVRRLRVAVPAHLSSALRKALARDPVDRFATVAEFAEALHHPIAEEQPACKAIAVLPFLNLSTDRENEYFADGITEDIILQLSKIRALRVISRSSVMRFRSRDTSPREIAAQLEATALVDGSVRRVGDRVRIVAELVDPETGRHLWAETYDRQLTDVFAIQSDVALRIATALEAELSADERSRIRKEPTRNVDAYQRYLQGRQCLLRFTAEGLRKSVVLFEEAIQLDPGYAMAWAGKAFAFAELGEIGGVPPSESFGRASEAANKALALDPDLAEAHCVLGNLKIVWEYDWIGAERLFRRAIELNPSSADAYNLYGRVCSAQGRFEQAVDMERRSYELDPFAHRADLATSLLRAGHNDEALEQARKALELDPLYDRLHATVGWGLIRTGRMDDGIAQIEKAHELSPGNTMWAAQLGQAYAMAGRTDEARRILRTLEDRLSREYIPPYHLAYVCTGLGEHDAAIDWLERAYEQRAGAVYGIGGSFLFEPLRGHPRFQALLRRMNLT